MAALRQLGLALAPLATMKPARGLRAIESEDFPFEAISAIAEQESWRKEIHRPIYHVHKWWAQRLGSVFRAIVIGALAPAGTDVLASFHGRTRLSNAVVFDPFMGSGTTVGEALKLGCRAIGRDINQVAYFLVRNALEAHDRRKIEEAFHRLTDTVRLEIEQFYKCRTPDGKEAIVLYFFWTKVLPCPKCAAPVDLIGRRIFAQHAYPRRHPECRALCPSCGGINVVDYSAQDVCCSTCRNSFDPQQGNTHGKDANCPTCGHTFAIAATARSHSGPPDHRMYAKLVLTEDGEKVYLPVDDFDRQLYSEAERRLSQESGLYPVVEIAPGYNTDQVLNYGYRYWHEMFNARQLLCLGLLAKEIRGIAEREVRDALACLFSGSLEFNNMFASYKGEGTGAVRHMFYHHILKPERMPLEANPWGTPKSSGSFSGMFKSRLLRALDYAEAPFEIDASGNKVFGLSDPMGRDCAETYENFAAGKSLYLSCGDSARTDIPDGSVDAVITDPPFFDNVNYSQLADFFHVWQRHIRARKTPPTTRSIQEVQHQDAGVFSERLGNVFAECRRVLKPEGVLAFSYHHSRGEGWCSVLHALREAGFVISATVPVKAEMSGAAPKNQAKEPIDLDIIVVCRKAGTRLLGDIGDGDAVKCARAQVNRLRVSGRRLSRNDVRIILMGQLLRIASQKGVHAELPSGERIEVLIDDLCS